MERTWGWIRAAILAGTLVAAGCGDVELLTAPPPPDPIDPNATFARVQTTIFTPTCAVAGCHDAFGRSAGLILSADQSWANIVNQPSTEAPGLDRVEPGDPDQSYLYRKVLGVGITGERMPAFSPPLSEESIRLIRDWIRRGAPNDA